MSEQPDRDEKHESKSRLWVFVLVFIACAAFVVFVLLKVPYAIERWGGIEGKATGVGEYGDQYGMANALFAGLAFAGVIVAMLMQSAELRLQRKELVDTQHILKGQRQQLEQQAASMRRQTFENTFFQMVSLYNQIVDEISTRKAYSAITLSGKSAIDNGCYIYKEQLEEFQTKSPEGLVSVLQLAGSDRLNAYNYFHRKMWYPEYESTFGHYFRHVYHTFKFIDQRGPAEEQSFYAGVFRAQLSSPEQILLFYNALSTLGREKALPLYYRHRLFDNLERDQLFNDEDWKLFEDLARAAGEPWQEPGT